MHTITADTTYTQKIKRSRFIGHARHIDDTDQAKAFLNEIHRAYPDATHHCPAYILGKQAQTQFCSDAGEPSGTAGRPILNVLLRHDLTNIAVVVTRYFGGIQLGVPGLIEAYTTVTEQTVALCSLRTVIDCFEYTCVVPYHLLDTFMYRVKIDGVVIKHTEYTDTVKVIMSITEDAVNKVLDVLFTFENAIQYEIIAFPLDIG